MNIFPVILKRRWTRYPGVSCWVNRNLVFFKAGGIVAWYNLKRMKNWKSALRVLICRFSTGILNFWSFGHSPDTWNNSHTSNCRGWKLILGCRGTLSLERQESGAINASISLECDACKWHSGFLPKSFWCVVFHILDQSVSEATSLVALPKIDVCRG